MNKLLLKSAKKEELSFYAILILGAVLRFYNYADWSLTNDELSAIMRVRFDSYLEMLRVGVKEVDVHPAATQTFEYIWINLFGNSAASVRFPFVVFGILGIYYSYRTASEWIGEFAALFVAASIAVSQYFILYSQIARPYVMGFFLVILFAYYWTLHLKGNTKIKISIGFIIGAWLSIITHYFASLTVILFLSFGLFLCKRANLKNYLIHLSIIVLLCLPHIPITLYHIGIGGVGGWLPKPEADFILKFLDYTTNDFWPFQTVLLIVPIVSIVFFKFNKTNLKWSLPGAFVFALTFLITYFYSIYVNAILQLSSLIFAFPFFIIFFFSCADYRWKKVPGFIFLALIVFSGVYATIFHKDLYGAKNFANFKAVSMDLQHYEDSLSSEDVLIFMNSNNPDYFNYYFKRQDNYQPEIEIKKFVGPEEISRLRDKVGATNKKYIIVAWANGGIPYEVHEIIKQSFPKRIAHKHYFNSELSVYAKGQLERKTVFKKVHKLEVPVEGWEVNMEDRDTTHYFSPTHSFQIKPSTLYTMTCRSKVGDIFKKGYRFLTLDIATKMDSIVDCKIVVSVKRNGENIEWRGYQLQDFYSEGGWFKCTYVFERSKNMKNGDDVSIYLWNPAKNKLWVDDFSLMVFKDSNYDYYDQYN